MTKVSEKLTRIAKMKSKKESSVKKTPVKKIIRKTAGEMELAQRVVEQGKRIAALEKAVAKLQELIV